MRMLRKSLIGFTVGLAVVLGTTPAPATTGDPVQILQNRAQAGVTAGYPGVIGMIREGDTTHYVGAGSGVYPAGQPVDPTAKYRIGSNTKAFTSTVVLQLEAEGRLSIDDTVARWLPNAVAAHGYDGNTITIRQLLNHTSGLPDHMSAFNLAYYSRSNINTHYTPQQLVDAALASRAPTNRNWLYANTNYILAGMIIQAVTGNTPATEVTNRIITPLGLTDTAFPTSDTTLSGNHIRGWTYVWIPLPGGWSVQANTPSEATVSNVELVGPAGAMISTLADQTAFDRALFGGRLLPPAQMAELKTTVPIGSNTSNQYGLGVTKWALSCGGTAWSHAGNVIGYFSRSFSSEDGGKQVTIAGNEHHGESDTNGQKTLTNGAADTLCAMS